MKTSKHSVASAQSSANFSYVLTRIVGLATLTILSGTALAEDPPEPEIDRIIVVGSRLQSIGMATWNSIFAFDGRGRAFEPSRGSIENGDENAKDKDKDCKSNDGLGGNGNGTSGNPVVLSTGNKVEAETDFASTGEAGLFLTRTYNRAWAGIGIFGKHWQSNFDYKLTFGTSIVNACYPRPAGGTCGIGTNTLIWAHRPDGRRIKFHKNAVDGIFYEEKASSVAKIVKQPDNSFVLYEENGRIEIYSSAGYISEVKSETGIGWTFLYSGTYPIKVTHTSGRYVDFVWTNGQLTSVRDPAGNYYGYAYLANRFGPGLHLLSATVRPGTPNTTIAYHYEKPDQLGALTGKSFGGVRYSWFDYSPNGRAISTEHGNGRDRYTFSYAASGEGEKFTTEVNPLGRQTVYSFRNEAPVIVAGSPSAHCIGTYREYNLDANGNNDLVSDFNGNITDYDYNAKGQLLKRIDAVGTPMARTTIYTWDTTSNRIVSIIIVGLRRTDYVYHTDNRIASITETNLSANGVASQSRTTSYTYTKHANGMLATVAVDGPIAGSGDVVVTSFNAFGDAISVSNSLGHAIAYSNHNGLGQPGRVTGPNGDIIDYLFDAQGRVTTERRWINGMAADTVYSYNAQGLLASLTAPDAAVTNYEYDSARRLTRTWRTANGTVAGGASKEDQIYSYDLMGNLTRVDNRKLVGHFETQCKRWMTIEGQLECVQEEQIWVEVPTITQTSFVDYDELGRIRARRGNNGQNIRYAHDAAGNISAVTDSLNRVTTRAYDALDRLITVTDSLGGITRFEYDAGDRITKVTDAKNLSTTYVYDGFGQLWAQSSPDTGTSAFQYNAAGQRTTASRADGSGLSYSYDALGRLTWYGTPTQGRSFTYDWCSNGIGRLCEANYGDGARHYAYTPQGQVAITRDFTAGLTSDDWTGYSYDSVGRLTGISYPSGISAGYAYSNGKLTTMTATIAGATQIVAGSINYHPFGGINNWTYGNNLQRSQQIDLDGRRTAIHTDGIQGLYYQYNVNDEITQITNGADANLTQTFGYDALGRLTNATAPGNTAGFGYDAIGNRISRTDNGVTTSYAYPSTSHKLQSAVNPTLARNFTSNGVGNIDGWHTPDGVYGTMTYDAYLRPNQHTRNGFTTTYTFNALDQRVKKYYGGGNTIRYVYAGQNTLLAERFKHGATGVSTWSNYLWLGGQPVGLVRNNTLYWIHADHLGRPEMATNASQQRVWRAANWAFNRSVVTDQIGGLNLGFPGQQWDSESSLWHNGFRDYEPTLGRYIQSDPIGLIGGVNTYGYVGSNPLNQVDILGLTACDIEAAMIAAKKVNRDMTFGDGLPVADLPRSNSHMRGEARLRELNPDFDNKIHVNEFYLDVLNGGYLIDLLNTVIHEGLHFTRPASDQVEANNYDHEYIVPEAARRTGATLKEFNKQRSKCGCEP